MLPVKKLKPSKGVWTAFKICALIAAIILALGFVIITIIEQLKSDSSYKNQQEINVKTINAIKEASKTAALKNKKVASGSAVQIPIPQNYGAHVNVPILTYHYVGNNPNPADKARDALSVTPGKFEEQMSYISKNGYNPISVDTLYAILKGNASMPSKPIVLTFDDGYIDFYTTVFPILRRFNFHAVSFIPTGLMNQGYYMSWFQIKEIDSTGLVSFGAHTVNHLNLASLPPDKLTYQLVESKKVLESELGKPVNFIAYPYGVSNELVWAAAKRAGYAGAMGTYFGTTVSEGNVYDMPRIKVSGAWSIEEFAKRI